MKLSIAIISFLLAAEAFTRIFSPSLSGNIWQIEQFPTIFQDLSRKQAENEITMVFLGNSLIGNAVDPRQFEYEFEKRTRRDIFAYKVVPDGTSFWDWYCVVKNSFTDVRTTPTTLVVGFAWGSVKPEPSRLATHFCGITDLPDLVRLGMNSTSDVVEYLFASTSKLYALRETIHKRLLNILIPGYREYAQLANARNRDAEEQVASPRERRGNSLISHLLLMLAEKNVTTVFIAMPVIKPYSLDLKIVRSIEATNAILYDYRALDGISDDMFRDPIHLNNKGSKAFTKQLISDLINGNNIIEAKPVSCQAGDAYIVKYLTFHKYAGA